MLIAGYGYKKSVLNFAAPWHINDKVQSKSNLRVRRKGDMNYFIVARTVVFING